MLPNFRLYFISDSRLTATPLPLLFREAAALGVRAFQIREKHLHDDGLRELANSIVTELKPYNTSVFINTRQDIAAELHLSLQLPENKIQEIAAIRSIRNNMMIAASTHSLKSAIIAQDNGADFILFGPVFATESKKQFGLPQGLSALAKVCKAVTLPVFAIGGVTPENAAQCMDNGAHGVACIGALMKSTGIHDTVDKFKLALGEL